MKQRFETSQWVPFRFEVVFAFFANPNNLPRLMPEGAQTRIEELRIMPAAPRDANTVGARSQLAIAAGVGSEIPLSFRPAPWLPFRLHWLAQISEFRWNSHFCDYQVRGPFAQFHHCHRFQAAMQSGAWGTTITDEIEYALPLGVLGGLGSGMVRRKLERSFVERQARLIKLIATT
jgi:ligand-binding SRPBCC domain-containing protein